MREVDKHFSARPRAPSPHRPPVALLLRVTACRVPSEVRIHETGENHGGARDSPTLVVLVSEPFSRSKFRAVAMPDSSKSVGGSAVFGHTVGAAGVGRACVYRGGRVLRITA